MGHSATIIAALVSRFRHSPARNILSPGINGAHRRGLVTSGISLFVRSESSQQLNDPYSERVCNGFERRQGHTLKATFQAIEVGPIETSAVRKLLLAPILLGPELGDSPPHSLLDILQLPPA